MIPWLLTLISKIFLANLLLCTNWKSALDFHVKLMHPGHWRSSGGKTIWKQVGYACMACMSEKHWVLAIALCAHMENCHKEMQKHGGNHNASTMCSHGSLPQGNAETWWESQCLAQCAHMEACHKKLQKHACCESQCSPFFYASILHGQGGPLSIGGAWVLMVLGSHCPWSPWSAWSCAGGQLAQ